MDVLEEVLDEANDDYVLQTIDIHALIRKAKKAAVLLLLRQKYGLVLKGNQHTLASLADTIEKHTQREAIVSDLIQVVSCYSEGDRDTFYKLCRNENINVGSDDPFQVMAVKCLIEAPKKFDHLQWASAVNRVRDKEVFSGKTTDERIEITDEHLETLAQNIAEMVQALEPGRKYEVSTAFVDQTVLFTSYFSERTRTVTAFSSKDKITTVRLTPASKVLAEYDVQNNRLFIRAGRPKK